jgi:hypothetical protein
MAMPFQTTLTWATEAGLNALADVMFAAVPERGTPFCLGAAALRNGRSMKF